MKKKFNFGIVSIMFACGLLFSGCNTREKNVPHDIVDIVATGKNSGAWDLFAFLRTYGRYSGLDCETNVRTNAIGYSWIGVKAQKNEEWNDCIVATNGTIIGIEYGLFRSVTNRNLILELKIVPPRKLKDPTGCVHTEFRMTNTIAEALKNPFIAHSFNDTWSRASGGWCFQIAYSGRILVEKRIDVVFSRELESP